MAMTNRMRKSGMGTTNRFQTGGSYLPAIGSATRPVPPVFAPDPTSGSQPTNLSNVDADAPDGTYRSPALSASWDSTQSLRKTKSMTADLRETLAWDAEPPSLPGKLKLYKKTLRALTPPEDPDIQELVYNLQYRMSQMKIGTIERLFLHFDANRSTDIERDEVRQLLHCFNVFPSEEKFDKIYRHIDLNNDGVITYGEFCKALCLPVDECDVDKMVVGKRHTGSLPNDDATRSTQVPRKKQLRPAGVDGKMYGSSLSYTEGDMSRMLPDAVSRVGSTRRNRKLGRQNSRRISMSSKSLLEAPTESSNDLWNILRQHAIQNGHTQLGWLRWLETGVPKTKDQSIEIEDLCDILQRKLNLHVLPHQVQKMVDELQLHGKDGQGINIHALNEAFGPRSSLGVLNDADRSNLAMGEKTLAALNGNDYKSTQYYLTPTTAREQAAIDAERAENEPQRPEPVLAELAAQVQSGPTDVSHAQMLRDFRRADPKGTGYVSMPEFHRILNKAVAKTAMKDLGMENFSELAGSDNVDYNSFIRYCMDFAGAYGANRGAAVTTLGRYNPMDRIEQHMNAYLDRHESAASEAMDTVGAHEDSPTLKKSPSRITGAPRPISPRVAGYRWRHPSVDQLFQNTNYITQPVEGSSQFEDETVRNTSKVICETFDKPCHPALHVPEAKLRRLREGRQKVESKVFEEDSRAEERYMGRLALFKKQNETYNHNLVTDERAHARHHGDRYAQVRYQPTGDLHAQSCLLLAQAEEQSMRRQRLAQEAQEAQMMQTKLEETRKPAKQYERLPFVGR